MVEDDSGLYALLALLDMIRMGKAREIVWAKQKITEIVGHEQSP